MTPAGDWEVEDVTKNLEGPFEIKHLPKQQTVRPPRHNLSGFEGHVLVEDQQQQHAEQLESEPEIDEQLIPAIEKANGGRRKGIGNNVRNNFKSLKRLLK